MEEPIWKNKSLEDLPNEEWKDIPNYEGLYQVSNIGRIKSLPRYHGSIFWKESILSQRLCNGYCKIKLRKNKVTKNFLVHRIVIATFKGYEEGKNEVDHIDTNRQNNRLNNLRWCTPKENSNFSLTYKRKCKVIAEVQTRDYVKAAKENNKLCKEVGMYDNGILIKVFKSASQAKKEIGYDVSSYCRGDYLHSRKTKYTFKYL